MADNLFLSSSKPKEQKVAVVITDGEPTGQGEKRRGGPLTTIAAGKLKGHARLAIVGIQDGSTEYMKSLASTPLQENYYPLGSFADLTGPFVDTLLEGVCAGTDATVDSAPPTPRTLNADDKTKDKGSSTW